MAGVEIGYMVLIMEVMMVNTLIEGRDKRINHWLKIARKGFFPSLTFYCKIMSSVTAVSLVKNAFFQSHCLDCINWKGYFVQFGG